MMLDIRMIDWMPIQQRMIEAGIHSVPNGKFQDSYRRGDYLHYLIEFNTPEDEMWFRLKWM